MQKQKQIHDYKPAGYTYHREATDGLVGHRIYATARSVEPPKVIPGSSRHKRMGTLLKNDAVCYIDTPFTSVKD